MQAAKKTESDSAKKKRKFVLVLNILSVFFYIVGVAIIIGSVVGSAYGNATGNSSSPYSPYY